MAFSIATHQYAFKKNVTIEMAASSTKHNNNINSVRSKAQFSPRIHVRVCVHYENNTIATRCMSVVVLHWLAIYRAD